MGKHITRKVDHVRNNSNETWHPCPAMHTHQLGLTHIPRTPVVGTMNQGCHMHPRFSLALGFRLGIVNDRRLQVPLARVMQWACHFQPAFAKAGADKSCYNATGSRQSQKRRYTWTPLAPQRAMCLLHDQPLLQCSYRAISRSRMDTVSAELAAIREWASVVDRVVVAVCVARVYRLVAA
ncbi:hypothetical protein GGI16_006797 [Coemansia sp. S142-1]|nr:hypothetical protein GGI16_006797 [Coemansia sp. S142-1]